MSADQKANKPVEIEFFNRTKSMVTVNVEPTCVSIDLDDNTEYKMVTGERFFRLEFDDHGQLIFYLQYSFGFQLFKRAASPMLHNPNEWILEFDWSDIN